MNGLGRSDRVPFIDRNCHGALVMTRVTTAFGVELQVTHHLSLTTWGVSPMKKVD
jgi:hypothetical protein